MMRKCNLCKETKHLDEFYGKSGYKCKPCSKAHVKQWKRENAGYHKKQPSNSYEATRQRQYKKRYGITIADYEDMYVQQDGKCAICTKPEPLLCVDHNHKTKEVRGLLCDACNTGIGLLGDKPDTVQAAADYLRERGHYGE